MTSPPTQLVRSKSRSTAARFSRVLRARPSLCPSRCPANRRACASLRTRAVTPQPKPKRSSFAAPERIAPRCRHFGVCGGCHYQHAGYKAQLAFKQAILRETLDRAGVASPVKSPCLQRIHGTIAIASAWPSTPRESRLSRPAIARSRSHRRVPHCRALLINAALPLPMRRGFAPTLRPTELSLFCDADEPRAGECFPRTPRQTQFDRFRRCRAGTIPALKGIELALEAQERRPAVAIAHWGAPSSTTRRRLRLSRRSRQLLPGQSLARGCARRTGHGRPTASSPGTFSRASASSRASSPQL